MPEARWTLVGLEGGFPLTSYELSSDNLSWGTENPTPRSTKVHQTTLAIDIGASGAVALLSPTGELLAVEDLPVLRDGPNARPTINAALLASITARWTPTQAVVEYVSARPGEAPSGAFAFGRSRGVIEGVLGAQAVPVRFVTAPWWKRRVGIPPGKDGAKDAARSAAIARWPAQADRFARKKDDGRAEACLIGLAYINDSNRGAA